MFKSTKSKTSTTNSSEYNSTNVSTDNRVAADNGAIVTRGNVYKTVTDGGAIKLSGEIAEAAIDAGVLFGRMGGGIADEGFDLARDSMGSTIDTLTAVIDQDRDEAAKLSEQLVNMIPYIVVGVVAWGIFK